MVAIATVLLLSFVIFVHESAHFFVARRAGMKVEEFFLGFGPKMVSWRRGETEYGIKWILFGGYVKIAGMNPLAPPSPEDLDRTYGAKTARWRAAVIVAGPLTHFVLAFLALYLLLVAFPTPVYGPSRTPPVIAAVLEQLNGKMSPASAAGLKPGDEVLSVDGEPFNTDAFIDYTHGHVGKPMTLIIRRDGEELTKTVTPIMDPVVKVGRIGIESEGPPVVGSTSVGPVAAIGQAASGVVEGTVLTMQGIGRVFSPSGIGRVLGQVFGQTPRSAEDPMTVVGVARAAGTIAAQGQFDILLSIFIQVNIFVGLINLVPLPPFDGGHIAVLVIEKIRRKPVDMLKVLPVAAVIVVLLVTYMSLVLFLDVFKPVPLGR